MTTNNQAERSVVERFPIDWNRAPQGTVCGAYNRAGDLIFFDELMDRVVDDAWVNAAGEAIWPVARFEGTPDVDWQESLRVHPDYFPQDGTLCRRPPVVSVPSSEDPETAIQQLGQYRLCPNGDLQIRLPGQDAWEETSCRYRQVVCSLRCAGARATRDGKDYSQVFHSCWQSFYLEEDA
jgi:hypothetical protein